MTYQITITEDAIGIRLPLERFTFAIKGQSVVLHKLPMALPFALKPSGLSDLGGGKPQDVYFFKRIDMDPMGYDYFSRRFLHGADWLKGQFFSVPVQNARACVMVVASGRPILFIDTQGYDYARYVARLG